MNIINKLKLDLINADFNTFKKALINDIGLNLNCMRIGIIESFNADDLTVQCRIASKKVLGNNKDGTQILADYPLLRAKIVFCNPYITYEPKQGQECILLFNDRELETWFINGQSNQQNHARMHDLTDCVAILGIRSLPNMINIVANSLNLFYGNSGIAIQDNSISIQADDVLVDSNITANNLNSRNGANGTFLSKDDKTITVTNGIITSIT